MTELKAGDQAPNFTLPTDGGGKISLNDFNGKNIILYFYPKDDTPGCTIEAKDFKDLKQEFENKNTVIIGVSKDTIKKHDKFKEKYDLNFPLISDEEGTLCAAYATWVEKSMYGRKYMGIERSTFLIDESAKIKNIWRKVKVKEHAKEVLNSI
jgi:peroxiredoxin Q/BCP